MKRHYPIDMECTYIGESEMYKGVMFLKGETYKVRYLYSTRSNGWDWYLIQGLTIPYTPNGFEETWEVLD